MKTTLTRQTDHDAVTTVTLTHPRTGYQLRITAGRYGFVIHSSEGVRFERYDDLSYEVKPDVCKNY